MGVGKGGMNLERYLNFCIMCSNMYARKKRITPSFFFIFVTILHYRMGVGIGEVFHTCGQVAFYGVNLFV